MEFKISGGCDLINHNVATRQRYGSNAVGVRLSFAARESVKQRLEVKERRRLRLLQKRALWVSIGGIRGELGFKSPCWLSVMPNKEW